jgi:predicted amidohydrolase
MPIAATTTDQALEAVHETVRRCERRGVSVLCCPEGALGGLADYAPDPHRIAIGTADIEAAFAPIASAHLTVIVGFSERHHDGHLYNSAAIFRRGHETGIYRKVHPAINHSVYAPGRDLPVFRVDGLTFGVVICNDSNYAEPAKVMAARGATVLFVPTNNGLPSSRGYAGVADAARACDIARAVENLVWVVRADVAGRTPPLVCEGATRVVDAGGNVVASAHPFVEDLLVAEIDSKGRRVW